MSFTESIAVEILGDSSQLQEELSFVSEALTDLESQFRNLEDQTSSWTETLQLISQANQPLQYLSHSLATITQQVQTLSQTPISLNTNPAVEALVSLSGVVQMVAAQLAMISFGGGGIASAMLPSTFEAMGPVAMFNTGGYVNGPAGIDQVPARLSAGEYVLNTEAVSQLGVSALDQMNSGRIDFSGGGGMRGIATQPHRVDDAIFNRGNTVINQISGINVHVKDELDFGKLLSEIDFQENLIRRKRG